MDLHMAQVLMCSPEQNRTPFDFPYYNNMLNLARVVIAYWQIMKPRFLKTFLAYLEFRIAFLEKGSFLEYKKTVRASSLRKTV